MGQWLDGTCELYVPGDGGSANWCYDLTNSPRHIAKVNLLAPLFQDKLFAGPELQYMSEPQNPSRPAYTRIFPHQYNPVQSAPAERVGNLGQCVQSLRYALWRSRRPKNIDKMSFPKTVAVFASS